MAEVKSFVIDRAKWGKKQLLNADGSMCCLGFLGQACGVSRREMGSYGYPSDLPVEAMEKLPIWTHSNNNDIDRLVSLNDDSKPSKKGARRCRADVEKYIAKTFAKHGIRVTFRGKAKKAVKS